jgi:glycosyltransferase involved in cell wall biosynthesis
MRDLAEKILELLADPERRKALGELGLERIRTELGWRHQAAKLLAAYDAVFSAPPWLRRAQRGAPPSTAGR